jgi:hypothetical protein
MISPFFKQLLFNNLKKEEEKAGLNHYSPHNAIYWIAPLLIALFLPFSPFLFLEQQRAQLLGIFAAFFCLIGLPRYLDCPSSKRPLQQR